MHVDSISKESLNIINTIMIVKIAKDIICTLEKPVCFSNLLYVANKTSQNNDIATVDNINKSIPAMYISAAMIIGAGINYQVTVEMHFAFWYH
jgi:hypothetical protein